MTALASLADGTTKLVGQWRFEEGTGSTVSDTSGNNNAGKFNGATWVEGKVGKALRFNQGQDYVEIPHHADLSPRSALTVEAWVNFDKAISWQKVIAKSLGSDTDYAIIQGTRNNVGFTFNIGTQVKTIYSATDSAPLGTWVYVVGTYDGKKTRLYINGKEDNSSYVSGLINDHKGPLRIGGDKSTINGKIDEVNIYNKALTAAEIMDRYKAYTETAPTNVAVTGVSLNKTSMSLNEGATEGLVATVAPSNATNKTVSWTSSNTAVATVDANGNVRAIAAGSATITVTTADGGKKATCAVTVTVGSSLPIQTDILKKMDTGFNFTLRVKENGTVWITGNKQDGKSVSVSEQMAGIEGVKGVAAVDLHAVMLKNDGTVWSWGLNSFGQFGNGTTRNSTTPVQMQGIQNAVAVAAGVGHSLALKSDGTVWGSGMNSSGQLGDGTTVDKTLPVQVQGLSGVKAIEIGRWHSLALKNDGAVWSWGVNNAGQLGDGTTVNKSRPVRVNNLANIVSIASGSCHSLAIKADGTVWSWGFNKYGQVGDGTTTNRTQPAQISGLTNVVAVSTGRWHSLALKNDGTVWSWGYNAYGQLGDGTTTNRYTPVQVKGLTNIVTIVAGECQSFAIDKNGTIWAWGSNGSGELGDGTTTNRTLPVVVKL